MARTAAASTATTRDSARMATTTATTTAAESTRTMASTRAARQGRPAAALPPNRPTVRTGTEIDGAVDRSRQPSGRSGGPSRPPVGPPARPSNGSDSNAANAVTGSPPTRAVQRCPRRRRRIRFPRRPGDCRRDRRRCGSWWYVVPVTSSDTKNCNKLT